MDKDDGFGYGDKSEKNNENNYIHNQIVKEFTILIKKPPTKWSIAMRFMKSIIDIKTLSVLKPV